VVERLQRALNERGKPLKDSRVLVLGAAYKKDVDDSRESPALRLMDLLRGLGAEVSYHDPHIEVIAATRNWPGLAGLASVTLDAPTVAGADAVLIATDHSAVDYELVAQHAKLIVDTRGVYRAPMEKLVKA
jgi:UDP-N-acetyl-D-glucosamine dehydrogenase